MGAATAAGEKVMAGGGHRRNPHIAVDGSEVDSQTLSLITQVGTEVERTGPAIASPPGIESVAATRAPAWPVPQPGSTLGGSFGRHPYLPSESGARHRVEPMARSSL